MMMIIALSVILEIAVAAFVHSPNSSTVAAGCSCFCGFTGLTEPRRPPHEQPTLRRKPMSDVSGFVTPVPDDKREAYIASAGAA
jgi:hypothetical protein